MDTYPYIIIYIFKEDNLQRKKNFIIQKGVGPICDYLYFPLSTNVFAHCILIDV